MREPRLGGALPRHGGNRCPLAAVLGAEYCKQTFYQGSLHRWTAKLTIVGGVRAVTYGIQAPNRFDLLVRAGLSPLALRQILLGFLPVLAIRN